MKLSTVLELEVEVEYTVLDETSAHGLFLPKMIDVTSINLVRHQKNGKPKHLDILRFIPEDQLLALEDSIMEKLPR